MLTPSQPTPLRQTLIQTTGALVFGLALAYAGLVHVVAFDRAPGAWSWTTGWRPVAANTALFTAFALHHSLFARLGVKAWVARIVGPALERSVYVWCASLLFIAIMRAWRDVPGVAWAIEGHARWVLVALQLAGIVVTVRAAQRLGVRRLAGLAAPATASPDGPAAALEQTGLYGFVRHPIYFAWILLVWPVPSMTGSRLLFALLSTAYLVAAIPLEERTLVRERGAAYRAYQRQVRWRMLPGIY